MAFLVANVIARPAIGVLSDFFRLRVPRVGWMTLCFAIAIAGHAAFFVAPSLTTVWIAAVCSGVSYGAYVAATCVCVCERGA